MVVSAFRSSSRRGSIGGSSKPPNLTDKNRRTDDSVKKAPIRRSRSVSAVTRSDLGRPAPPKTPGALEIVNTRDNPLFDCSSSSPSPPDTNNRSLSRRDFIFDNISGRSLARTSDLSNGQSSSRASTGPWLRQSVSMDRLQTSESEEEAESSSYLSLGRNEKEIEYSVVTKNLQRWTGRHPINDSSDTSSIRQWEEANSTCYFSDAEEAVPRKGIWKKYSAIDNTENKVDVYPGGTGLVSNVRSEYAIQLEQSQERALRLRADLAAEELREQELSRILKEVLADKRIPETHKARPKRKTSIERLKISRRLAEEAMTYFDECVSISTFDSSDFSSQEEHRPSAVVPFDTSATFSFSESSSLVSSVHASDQFHHNKESRNCSRFSFCTVNSQQSSSSSCNSSTSSNLVHENFINEVTTGDRKLGSIRSTIPLCFPPKETTGLRDIRDYIAKIGKMRGKALVHGNKKSSYNSDDYDTKFSDESLLFDKVIYRSRIEYGSLLVCSTRIF